ncbi:hypothetical protein G3I28_23135, partial [Streptomyces sp. SID10116]|nr:hypothetical protein [Streptomyces sp. SID10116]
MSDLGGGSEGELGCGEGDPDGSPAGAGRGRRERAEGEGAEPERTVRQRPGRRRSGPPPTRHQRPEPDVADGDGLAGDLRAVVRGDVDTSVTARALHTMDASNY